MPACPTLPLAVRRFPLLPIAVLSLALPLAGCISHPQPGEEATGRLEPGEVRVVGPRLTERSLARVEALNPRGSIRVVVDDTLRAAEVRATIRKHDLGPADHARLTEQLEYTAITTIAAISTITAVAAIAPIATVVSAGLGQKSQVARPEQVGDRREGEGEGEDGNENRHGIREVLAA